MKNDDEVKLFEESEMEAHEEDMGEYAEKNQSDEEEMMDAAGDLFSTACNTPNLSCIDEA